MLGGIPALWRIGGELVKKLGYMGDSEIPQTLMFVSVGSLISFVLGLPWSAYFTFKVEQKHGFNKQVKLNIFPLSCKIVTLIYDDENQ